MNKAYINSADPRQCLARLIEEAGEVLAAAGKSARFGFDSFNPELPVDQQETNADWLLREMDDLQHAMNDLRQHLVKK